MARKKRYRITYNPSDPKQARKIRWLRWLSQVPGSNITFPDERTHVDLRKPKKKRRGA